MTPGKVGIEHIQRLLHQYPGVIDAVVLRNPQGERRPGALCAYFAADHFVPPAALRGYLATELPRDLLPRWYVQLAEIPRRADNSADVGALAVPDDTSEVTEYAPPRDEVEETLVRMWEPVIGVPRIGIRDSLFDLGADSLTAARLAATIREQLGVAVPAGQVLRHPTVERLAVTLREAGDGIEAARMIPPAPSRADHPLSPQQRRVYVDQLKDSGSIQYNLPVLVTLPSGVDQSRLEDAFRSLLARHDILRSAFRDVSGESRQFVLQEVPFALPRCEATGSAVLTQWLVRPFDLAEPPLLRAVLASDNTLGVDLHHIITDGMSLMLMFAELEAFYEGRTLTPVAVQYPDYVEWIAAGPGAERRGAAERHWLRVFADPPSGADLPTDNRRPPVRARDGAFIRFLIGSGQASLLRQVAQRHDTTLFTVIAAAYCAFHSRITGSDDVIMGTPMLGRDFPGGDQAVGMFVNTVCLRARLLAGRRFAAFLGDLHSVITAAADHQDYPFELLAERVGGRRDYSRNPLFDMLFAYQEAALHQIQFLGAPVRLAFHQTGQTMFDLDIQVYELPDDLEMVWTYSTALFTRATIDSLRAEFQRILTAIAADPEITVGALTGTEGSNETPELPVIEFEFPSDR